LGISRGRRCGLGTQQSIDDIIRKSFNQFQHDRSVPRLQAELEQLERRAEELKVDKDLLKKVKRTAELKEEIARVKQELMDKMLNHALSLSLWSPGRLIRVKNWGVGIVVAPLSPAFSDPYFLDVALPCRKTEDPQLPYVPVDVIREAPFMIGIFPIFLSQIEKIYKLALTIPADLTVGQNVETLKNNLKSSVQNYDGNLPAMQWAVDLEVDNPSVLIKLQSLDDLELELLKLQPSNADIEIDIEPLVEEKIQVMAQIDRVKKEMENSMMLSFQEEYKARYAVLKKLGHINANGVLTLKGKAACEIDAGDELVCAELLFNGLLKKVDKNYLIAFLSCLVPTTEKAENEVKSRDKIECAFQTLRGFAQHIADVSVECKVDIEPSEYVDSFHMCYVDVMHAWETGSSFIQVSRMSQIYEGVIIRSARRLAELIQQLSSAARVMGDMELVEQLDNSNVTLKRDIMFAASLYV